MAKKSTSPAAASAAPLEESGNIQSQPLEAAAPAEQDLTAPEGQEAAADAEDSQPAPSEQEAPEQPAAESPAEQKIENSLTSLQRQQAQTFKSIVDAINAATK